MTVILRRLAVYDVTTRPLVDARLALRVAVCLPLITRLTGHSVLVCPAVIRLLRRYVRLRLIVHEVILLPPVGAYRTGHDVTSRMVDGINIQRLCIQRVLWCISGWFVHFCFHFIRHSVVK